MLLRSIVRAACAVALTGTVAHAQLGGLIKRAAGKLEQKAENKDDPATKPMPGDPVTADALDGVLKGLAVEASSAQQAAKIEEERSAKAEAARAAHTAAGDDASKWRSANSKAENCIHASIEASNEAHQEALKQRMMNLGADPGAQEFVRKYGAASQKLSKAQQKGDTVAVKQAIRELEALVGENSPKDSAAAYAKCGRPPAKPASMVEEEKLDAELQALNEELRKVEGGASDRAAEAAGLSAQKYAQARERLWAWNEAIKAKRKAGDTPVTKDEDALFRSREADIQKFAKQLR